VSEAHPASTLPVLTLSTSQTDSSRTAIPKLDLSDILASACELANARAAKILGVRADQHAALSITEFVEIFKENWDFVVATETLAKRMIVSLRGVTASQVGGPQSPDRVGLISRLGHS